MPTRKANNREKLDARGIPTAGPALLITVPDGTPGDPGSTVLFPEHVTARARGQSEQEHLYIYPGAPQTSPPKWIAVGLRQALPGRQNSQHVDPEVPLPKNATAAYEVKILVFRGSLDDALRKVEAQRNTLR